jgi:hypothetical protein
MHSKSNGNISLLFIWRLENIFTSTFTVSFFQQRLNYSKKYTLLNGWNWKEKPLSAPWFIFHAYPLENQATKSKRHLTHKLSHHIVNSLQFKIDETRWMSQQIKMICLGKKWSKTYTSTDLLLFLRITLLFSSYFDQFFEA